MEHEEAMWKNIYEKLQNQKSTEATDREIKYELSLIIYGFKYLK